MTNDENWYHKKIRPKIQNFKKQDGLIRLEIVNVYQWLFFPTRMKVSKWLKDGAEGKKIGKIGQRNDYYKQ